jgi:hypothetical protein
LRLLRRPSPSAGASRNDRTSIVGLFRDATMEKLAGR